MESRLLMQKNLNKYPFAEKIVIIFFIFNDSESFLLPA